MNAWVNIRLLLWVYERSYINGFILGEVKSRWKHAGAHLSRIVAFIAVYLVFRYLMFAGSELGHFDPSNSSHVLSSMIHIVGVILLLGAIKFSYQVFYLSADLEWLLASPIPVSRIFFAKFMENVFYGGHVVFSIGWPVAIAYGAFISAPAYYYPIALLLMAGLTLYSGSIGLLVCLPLMRYVSSKRLRELLLTLSMGLSIGIYILFRRIGASVASDVSGFQPEWLPTTHLTNLLVSTGGDVRHGSIYSYAAYLIPAFILALLAYTVSLKLYVAGLQRKSEEEGKIRSSGGEGLLYAFSRVLSPDIRSVMLKDALETIRNPRQWFYLIFAVVILGFPHYGGAVESTPMMNLFFILFISSIFSQELTILAFAREAEMFGILAASGLPAWKLYISKWLTAFVPTIIFATVATIITGIIQSRSTGEISFALLIVALGVGTLVSYSLLLGSLFPDFKTYRSRRRVSPWAMFLNMFFCVILIFLVITPLILDLASLEYDIPVIIAILPIYFSTTVLVLMVSSSFMVSTNRLKGLLRDIPI